MLRRWYSTVFGLRNSALGGFAGGPALGQQHGDLQLPGRQPGGRALVRAGDGGTGRRELVGRRVGPGLSAEPDERLQRRLEHGSSIDPATGSAEPDTVRELGPGAFEAVDGGVVEGEGDTERRVQVGICRQQGSGPSGPCPRPRLSFHVGLPGVLLPRRRGPERPVRGGAGTPPSPGPATDRHPAARARPDAHRRPRSDRGPRRGRRVRTPGRPGRAGPRSPSHGPDAARTARGLRRRTPSPTRPDHGAPPARPDPRRQP